MEYYENEYFIDEKLKENMFYKEDHKQLEEMGFDPLFIKKIYAFNNITNIDNAINFMTKENNIYQHEFLPNIENEYCFYCKEKEENHIPIKIYENEIKKKEKDVLEIKENDDSNFEFDCNKINVLDYKKIKIFIKIKELKDESGDKIDFDEKMYKKLKEKGKNSTCKIISKDDIENALNGTGFFCRIPYLNKKIKVLLTNNHILNYNSIRKGNEIKLSYKNDIKFIQLTDERNYWTNETYDFTCIEILNKDGIKDFYEMEIYDSEKCNNKTDIMVVQYPRGLIKINKGSLISINDTQISHNVKTNFGSSGSPIILFKQNKVIGIHRGYSQIQKVNLGINIKYIIDYINKNEISYSINIEKDNLENEIQILNYVKSKSNLFSFFYNNDNDLEKCFEIILDKEKIPFCWKYKFPKEGKYTIKFISNQLLWNMNHIFSECNFITYIDLSYFNTIEVFNMSYLFNKCNSLTNIDLSNTNTINVKTMEGMFYECSKLESLNLSNFNTKNVNDMSYMFFNCSSLINLDLSKFDTSNVNNISYMFNGCVSLNSLNLSYFKTNNVKNMELMFYKCSSLTSLDLSNFNTDNVTNMYGMFSECSSLTSLNLSNFNTKNVNDMRYMFFKCSSLITLNISKFNSENAKINSIFEEANEKCVISCSDNKIIDEYQKEFNNL